MTMEIELESFTTIPVNATIPKKLIMEISVSKSQCPIAAPTNPNGMVSKITMG